MKFKTLLFFFLLSVGAIHAQDTIRTLIISEARLNVPTESYIEITNMGEQAVNLGQFKVGELGSYQVSRVYDPWVDPITPREGYWLMLPDSSLAAGESFVIKNAYDFGPRQYRNKVPGFETTEREMQPEWYDLADLLIHMPEDKGDETDSISPRWRLMSDNWSGRSGFYIEQHLNETDSVTIDQVGGVFDNDGKNSTAGNYDVAGVAGATSTHILVRKFTVKAGNPDFANARGLAPEDSEWIPLVAEPSRYGEYRDVFWTVGNHGDYNLDETTLVPLTDEITVDFAAKEITVPYHIRRGDGLMENMEKKPGVAWQYIVAPSHADSLTFASRTGDQIIISVCGNDLDQAIFDIIVSEPSANANKLVPVINKDAAQSWRSSYPIMTGRYDWPWITESESGPDTISGTWHGIPYATRVDSLLERLEKPANASWEFVWVDGVERPDLKDGDILKVTSEGGTAREYYIEMQPYNPSSNAFLSAISWPDMPEELRGLFGWKGDTIPNFSPSIYNYRVGVPAGVDGVPALIAKKADLNSTVTVNRATTLDGTIEESTVEFVVTAENGEDTHTYSVELVKELAPENVQPYTPEPFISELVNNSQWRNRYIEIVNPGNQPLDLSDYMIASDWGVDATTVITNENSWMRRYNKYVPGYKWVDSTTWKSKPATLEPDLNVTSIVQPGEVFVLGAIRADNISLGAAGQRIAREIGYHWQIPDVMDVQFNNYEDYAVWTNPWNEPLDQYYWPPKIGSNGIFIFKILNDSVKDGTKPATDPNDFELVESVWNPEGNMTFGGKTMPSGSTVIRKPDVFTGNTEHGASFGETPEDSEWTMITRDDLIAQGEPYPQNWLYIVNDIGQHYMNQPTHYMSTVRSSVYKVSEGYSLEEDIRGVRTTETVTQFLGNIIKADEDQTLQVMRGDTELADDALLNMGDVLYVLSADSANVTHYALEVTEEGLSSDAALTSAQYDITITDDAGVISGFEYGTNLRTIVNNVTVPAGAALTIIDEEGAYVPLRRLNYDTTYVNVSVNHEIYFEVVAEDGNTKVLYQLQPNSSENDAFILSDVYTVTQSENLVRFVPRGTNVEAFLDNIVPATGATVKIVNKMGQERTEGTLYQDDIVVVTSANGEETRTYHLAMLRTQYVLAPDYLAYVLSSVYRVDQLNYVVEGPAANTMVSEFNSNITAAAGATAVVVDSEGNEKTSGELSEGDMVKVTSADSRVVVMYEIDIATSANKLADSQVKVYPNPTSGKVNIQGVELGTRIQVYSQTGALVKNVITSNSLETVSLDTQPSGMYLFVLTKDSRLVGQYKIIRR